MYKGWRGLEGGPLAPKGPVFRLRKMQVSLPDFLYEICDPLYSPVKQILLRIRKKTKKGNARAVYRSNYLTGFAFLK